VGAIARTDDLLSAREASLPRRRRAPAVDKRGKPGGGARARRQSDGRPIMTSGATGRDAMFRRAILELRVRLHRAWLVGELAEGTPPTTSRRHWRCAEELLSRAHRAELALGLERLIQEADHPHPGLSAAIPPQRQQ